MAKERRLNTKEVSKLLKEKWNKGYSPSTLETYRSIGGGPKFHKFGRAVYYLEPDLDEWVLSGSSGPFNNTHDK